MRGGEQVVAVEEVRVGDADAGDEQCEDDQDAEFVGQPSPPVPEAARRQSTATGRQPEPPAAALFAGALGVVHGTVGLGHRTRLPNAGGWRVAPQRRAAGRARQHGRSSEWNSIRRRPGRR
ncbi:hypothetical protein ACWIID_24550 [Streptomyces phaeochromogenes]